MTFDELKAKHAAMTPGSLVVGEWTAYDSKEAESYHLYIEKKHGPHIASWLTKPNALGIVALHNAFPALAERYEAMREACGAMLDEYEAGRSIQPFEIREMCRKALALVAKPLTETGT